MTRTRLYTLSALCLALTTPWFFTTHPGHLLGFPLWALYSLFVTLLYAALIALILQRYWSLLAGDDENGDGRP